MMNRPTRLVALALSAGLAGCATYPTGPSLMALPGNGSTFEQFRLDDAMCQGYAQQMLGGKTPQQAASDSGANTAAVGAVVGAAAGALIGAASGDPAAGAAIGGGSGLLLGSASASDSYSGSGYLAQNRYDDAYIQCMYAKGHQVPVPASVAKYQQSAPAAPAYTPPPPASSYPAPNTPPPPGY